MAKTFSWIQSLIWQLSPVVLWHPALIHCDFYHPETQSAIPQSHCICFWRVKTECSVLYLYFWPQAALYCVYVLNIQTFGSQFNTSEQPRLVRHPLNNRLNKNKCILLEQRFVLVCKYASFCVCLCFSICKVYLYAFYETINGIKF